VKGSRTAEVPPAVLTVIAGLADGANGVTVSSTDGVRISIPG